ncbi:MAG: DUF86 domain-containing protein [Deltaproteobacteria bacterium]|nr:DUF86 domain-containing protein [Deltaproteobacteria bacterium]
MSRRDPLVRLRHMRDFARKAVALTEGKSKGDLEKNEVLRLAVTHLVELIGEAASHIPVEVQTEYAHIPWPKIVGMRNRLIHGYDFVDMDILWEALQSNVPQLLTELDSILDTV